MSLGCALGKLVDQVPATEEELRAMRAAVWHKQGILVVKPDALCDDWERQCLTNIGNRLFGERATVPALERTAAPAVERAHG